MMSLLAAIVAAIVAIASLAGDRLSAGGASYALPDGPVGGLVLAPAVLALGVLGLVEEGRGEEDAPPARSYRADQASGAETFHVRERGRPDQRERMRSLTIHFLL